VKILDVSEFYSQRGGGVRSHLTLKSHFSCQHGHEHVVVAPGPRDEEEDQRPAGARGSSRIVRVGGPSLPYDPTYHLLWRVGRVRALCAREQPDILEIHSPYLAAASALSVPRDRFGARTFMWHADFIDTYLRTALVGAFGAGRPAFGGTSGDKRAIVDVALAPLWGMVRAIARRCDRTIVAGKWQADKLASHGVPRVEHIPFGVEKSVFSPRARSEDLRRELRGSRDTARILVGVGRFAVEKRWDVVLDAFGHVRALGADAILLLFGDGPERAAMQAKLASFSPSVAADVRFLGFERDRARLGAALASADLLVHACPFETFGLGVAEAKSAGLPVVVPDEGGAAEIVDESCGARYRAGDALACGAAVKRLLDRDPSDLRAAAEAAAERVPSVDEHFTRLFELELYARLARIS
jgi:alpha-1,6-mannosyltransferase